MSNLWEEARNQFANELLNRGIDKATCDQFLQEKSTPQEAKKALVTIQNDSNKKYGGAEASSSGKGIPGKWIARIMSNIDRFVQVGNMAMSYAPETVKTGWFVVTQVLNGVSNNYKLYELFGSALGDITDLMVLITHYDNLYHQPHEADPGGVDLLDQLFSKIRLVYVAILDFGFSVRKHIKGGKLARIGHGLKDAVGASKGEFDDKRATINGLKEQILHDSQGVFQQRTLGSLDIVQTAVSEAVKASLENQEAMKQILDELKASKFKTIQDLARQEFQQNKDALNPLPHPEQYLKAQLKLRHENTCSWVFEHEQYQSWVDSSTNSILFVSGESGSGKSVLLAAITEALQNAHEDDQNCVVIYMPGDEAETDEKSATSRYQNSILFSLYELALEGDHLLIQRANGVIQNPKKKKETKFAAPSQDNQFVDFADIFESLAVVLSRRRCFLVVDCMTVLSEPRNIQLLENLQSLSDATEAQVQMIISCRQGDAVHRQLAGKGHASISMQENNRQDIETLLEKELDQIPGLLGAEREIAAKIILEKTGVVFSYLIKIAVPFLRRPLTRPIPRHLSNLPDDLHETYDRAFRRLPPNSQELLKLAITWILISNQDPVHVNEIMDVFTGVYLARDQEETESDHEVQLETEPLYLEQMREVAGPFLDFVEDNETHLVKLQDPVAIRKFCVRDMNDTSPMNEEEQDNLCPRCHSETSTTSHFTFVEKFAHLDLALKLFAHLESPTFHNVWCVVDSSTSASEDGDEDAINEDGDTGEMAQESKEHSEDEGGEEEVEAENENENENEKVQGGIEAETGSISNEDSDNVENETNPDKAEANSSKSTWVKERGLYERDRSLDSEDREIIENESVSTDDDVVSTTALDSIRYEYRNWVLHARKAEEMLTQNEKKESKDWQRLQEHIQRYLGDAKLLENWSGLMALKSGSSDPEMMTWKPLHIASFYNLATYAKTLIDSGHDLYELSNDGNTPLHLAVQGAEYTEMVKILLEAGADPNWESEESTNPVICKVFEFDPSRELISALLTSPVNKASCKIKDMRHGFSPLHWYAAFSTNVSVLDLLLKNEEDPDNVAQIDVKDNYGETAFHNLMQRAQIPTDMLEAFIEAGADINAEDESSERPLYEAASYGDSKAVATILPHVDEIDDENDYGQTALMAAARNGFQEICSLLLQHGADPTKTDKHSRTAFFSACSASSSRVVASESTAQGLLDAMVERGCDVETINMPTSTKRTPLREAAHAGYASVVDSLLAMIDDKNTINLQDTRKGQHALHRAAKAGRDSIVKKLLASGADANLRDWSWKMVDGLTQEEAAFDQSNKEDEEKAGQENGTNGDENDEEESSAEEDDEGEASIGADVEEVGEEISQKTINGEDADENGDTPLDLAVEQWEMTGSSSFEATIFILAEHDPIAAVKQPKLMSVAATHGSARILEKIADNGGDINQHDEFGWTALMLATHFQHQEAIAFLSQRLAQLALRPKRLKPVSAADLSDDGLSLKADGNTRVCVYSDKPIPSEMTEYYYEVTLDGETDPYGPTSDIAIGLATSSTAKLQWPGQRPPNAIVTSLAYQGDDGGFFTSEDENEKGTGTAFGPGDTVGCGFSLVNRTVFFTLNGERIDSPVFDNVRGRLFPVLGLNDEVSLTVNFGNDVAAKPFKWQQQ